MPIDMDFDGVPDDLELVPAGSYRARVAQAVETAKDGKECWELTMEIVRGDGSFGQAGRTVRDRLFFTEKALSRAKGALSVLGVDVKGRVKLAASALLGQTCTIHVVHRPNEDKSRMFANLDYRGYSQEPAKGPTVPAGGSGGAAKAPAKGKAGAAAAPARGREPGDDDGPAPF